MGINSPNYDHETEDHGIWQKWEGRWEQLKGKAQELWGQLTNDDLDVAQGNYRALVGKIKAKTGEAEQDIQEMLNRDDDKEMKRRAA